MKNMEMICATLSNAPIRMNAPAIMIVTIEALKGSPLAPFPFASQAFTPDKGSTLSFAMACKVLGATMMEPSAEEIVAAASPTGMIHQPCQAISDMTRREVSARSCGPTETANLYAMNT